MKTQQKVKIFCNDNDPIILIGDEINVINRQGKYWAISMKNGNMYKVDRFTFLSS